MPRKSAEPGFFTDDYSVLIALLADATNAALAPLGDP